MLNKASKHTNLRARITTYFNCTEEELWYNLIKPASLQFVASPILTFDLLNYKSRPEQWQINTPYRFRIRLFGIIPLGEHTIRLTQINSKTKTIRSRESGRLATVWNHDITFHKTDQDRVRYTDNIEIRAGLLTPAIWLFAHLFYRHRQRRWHLLLNMDMKNNTVI